MRMCKGKHYWSHGFENEFEFVYSKKNLEANIKFSEELTHVVRTVIINDKGETLYDEQKEDPTTPSSKKDGRSSRTKKKETVRKEDGSGTEWKRSVCRPQDTN